MAFAAPTQIATKSSNTSGQTSWAPSLTGIPAGALAVLVLDNAGGTADPTSVSDGTNSWTRVANASGSRTSLSWVSIWYHYYASAPGTVTLTVSFASSNEVFGWVGYTTGSTATPEDASGNNSTLGTSLTVSTSTTLAHDNEIAFIEVGTHTATLSSLPTSYTQLFGPSDATRGYSAQMAYRILTGGSGTTESYTSTESASQSTAGNIATFAPAAAAAAVWVPTFISPRSTFS